MKSQRIDWIDSIRGLAAFFVMIIHYFHIGLIALLPVMLGNPNFILVPAEHDTLRDTLDFFARHHVDMHNFATIGNYILGYWDLGKIGVALFFLVSGVVIPYSLFKPESPIRNFIISRFFRLYPIYWVSLSIILLFGMTEIPLNVPMILANYTMFQKFIGIPDINGVAWTLQIELAFYISCALLFFFNQLKSKKANYMVIGCLWVMSLALAYIRMKFGIKAPIAMPLGLSLMFLGYVWRKWLLDEENIPLSQLLLIGFLYVILIPVVSWMGYGESAWTYTNTYFIAMVLFVLFTTIMRMQHPILLFLGKISYSVYLIHALVGSIIIPAIVRTFPTAYLHNNYLIFLPMLVAMACTLIISTVTYYLVEAPCVKLGRNLAQKIVPRQNMEPAGAL